MRNTLDI